MPIIMPWVMTPPYVQLEIGGYPIHNPEYGVVQRDPLDHALGLIPTASITQGGGQHGATTGRMIFTPGILTVPVDIFATTGTTEQQKELSYRDNIDRLKLAVTGTQLRCDAIYGASEQVRRSNCVSQQWIQGESIPYGYRWYIPLLILQQWRPPNPIVQEWLDLSEPQFLDLTNLAGGSGPLTDLELEVTGPATKLEILVIDEREGSATDLWSMLYDVAIPLDEVVTLKTDPETATIEASDPALVDYSAWSHPGNPAYILEIPAGAAGAEPRIKVFGAPAKLKITGKPKWLSL